MTPEEQAELIKEQVWAEERWRYPQRVDSRVQDMQEEILVLRQKVRLLEREKLAPPILRGRAFPSQFVRQQATIKAGQTGSVWSYKGIREEYPALIRYLGVKWFANTIIFWEIDGEEQEQIKRTIGDPNGVISNPFVFAIPYIARDAITFTAQNDSTTDSVFEIYCNGEHYSNREAEKISFIEPRRSRWY